MGFITVSASKAARKDLMHGIEAELMDQPSTTWVQMAAAVIAFDSALFPSPAANDVRVVVAAAMNGIQISRKLNSIATVIFFSTGIIDFATRYAGIITIMSSVTTSMTRTVMFRAFYEAVSIR